MVWWRAATSGNFVLIGLSPTWSDALGPLLPSLCAGLTAAMLFSIADVAIGPIAGLMSAVILVLLPGFLPVHTISLTGPPLLAIVILFFSVMLQAPRFSLAYGTVAAVAAVSVSPSALGLPVAAILWAMLKGGRTGSEGGSPRRAIFALVPLIAVVVLAHWTGGDWSPPPVQQGPGGLDQELHLAGSVIGDQLAPGVTSSALRWFVVAGVAMLLIALVGLAWRKIASMQPGGTVLHRVYPAAAVLAVSYSAGIAVTVWGKVGAGADLAAVLPLVAVALVVVLISAAAFWPRWPLALRVLVTLLGLGWVLAAITS